MTRGWIIRGLLATVLWLAGPATASAQLPASCTISATGVAFGNYNVFTPTDVDSTGTITYRCNSQAANISIALSKGASSTFAPRTLTKGAEALSFDLYRNAARTQVWGDGTGGSSMHTVANPANNQDVNVTVYGRIPALQDVSAGPYGDTVVATINF